ncbi:MAG: glucoamylase family protein [Roseiarcus sp.]|jgi:cyclic beta-1,2-glucan synthetase
MVKLKSVARRALESVRRSSPWDNQEPIREELFSVERLEEHARSLALAQIVSSRTTKGQPLARRLVDNGAVLLEAYRSIVEAINEGRAITPAAEWLVDNYHLVEKQIREIRSDLPPGYYRQLPKLASGPFAGYPRVFGMAWAFVAHTDSRFDAEMLVHYVRAYQEVQPLTIGELWAVSITLRIVLVENLGRLAQQITQSRAARQMADGLADRLLGSGGRPAESVAVVLFAHERAPLSEAFAVQLVHRLRDQDPRITPALTWLDQRLALQGTTTDAVVRDVHRRQGASNVTVRNIITSLRLISDVDWKQLFERLSLVDAVFAADSPFEEMDFPTRTLYRSAVEELARGSNHTELEVASAAVLTAKRERPAAPTAEQARRGDPGYHLLAGGRRAFEAAISYRLPLRNWAARLNRSLGVGGYVTAISLVAAILLAAPLLALASAGLSLAVLSLLGVLGAIPAIDAAVALVNRAVNLGFAATLLPGLELRGGVPSHLRTLVAVPTLLTTLEAIEEQIERLEIHHLASPEGDLHFALVSDWTDAANEYADGDAALVAAAAEGVARLNLRYGPAPGGARFLLLHRRRVWNEGEARWIGWERKRGKLHELNRLLRAAGDTTFIDVGAGSPVAPTDIRYVVTLDADTRLPRDTVRRLIGKMAHPLNRPRLDTAAGRVVEGYAVLQPRVTPSLPIGREGSLFQRIFSSLSGIDPYASAVSDVYQDLFGEGSYAGKGIYDVDAFEAALAGRAPDSTLLSHDLFEGVFARAGLASDIEVVEEFPARYDVGAIRHHRWARGDWQLLPWILGRPPMQAGAERATSAIPAIGRWKMLDNLRRTLSAPAATLALLAGWTLPLHAALIWTLFVVLTIALPTLIPVIAAIPPRRPGVTMSSHVRALGGDLRLALTLSALTIAFLADQAWLMADAIGRTLWRLGVTRRHLLEWVPAAQAAIGPRLDLLGFTRRMAGAIVIGAVGAIVALAFGHGSWPLALPFAALWVASPAVARRVSLPPGAAARLPMSDADAKALRRTARRTWRFFETFVTSTDNMLPPDNFQDNPTPAIAHRTSPTNLGLYLLSVVSARDFGWIGIDQAVERLEATLATMSGLQRFRGHFYNWYDTRDLRALDPRYVSTVDSGNLAGHLIALANVCREWRERPFEAQRRLDGVVDALDITCAESVRLRDGGQTQTVTLRQLDDALAVVALAARQAPGSDDELAARLVGMAADAETMTDIAGALAIERGDGSGADMLFWAQASLASIAAHRQDLTRSEDAARSVKARLSILESAARSMALAMDFGFLFDRDRQLLSIGFLAPEGALDSNCYDLLASEARLASFFAIAKGDVEAKHWFRLGRAATPVAHGAALISWSGSMFEYLMPSLVMRAPAGSLLEQTNRLIVRRQIDYAAKLGLPWGISESAYNARDLEFTYQYSNFGVPGLGLKRGLGENRVIAPYATALAAMVDPGAAAANLARLAEVGAQGRYGFHDALDYTPARVPEGESVAVVRAFMAHHQGMTIVAIADALFNGVMRERFHAEPIVKASELLLQERMPRDVAVARPWAAEVKSAASARDVEPSGGRRFASAHQATPATHLLSNGRYATMLTSAGSGYSRWGDLALTRWREDATCDDFGSYIFIKDVRTGVAWSAGFQPSGVEPDHYAVVFNEDRAEVTRRDGSLTTTLDVLVSAEDDAEVRRVSITNSGSRMREVEITSYAELVLAPQSADIAHPAFSKLFVETEYLVDVGAILATRRRRAPTEPEIWAAHLSVVDGEAVGAPEFETDRARFLGRGRGVRTPIAVMDSRPLSNSIGAALDPIFSIRRRIRVAPGATVRVAFWTIAASSRAALLDGVDKHRDATAFARASMLAWTQAQVQLHHLGVTAGEAGLFQRLAGHVIYAAPALRPSSDTIVRGGGAQSGLWSQGVSGDLPIVLLRIADVEHLDIVRELLQAHEYWRMKQLAVDLVILNERQSSYVQELQIAIETLVRASQSRPQPGAEGQPGRVFVLRADLISAETRALLTSVARVVLPAQRGGLFEQLERILEPLASARAAPKRVVARLQPPSRPRPPDLEFFNGLGGFARDGAEYVTILGPGQSTPAPWINVIANPAFGFQTGTEGGGYTWSVNSRENQITPWSNDPVSDRGGEAFYLRDDDTGDLWGPTALPIRDAAATYTARHGRGYSRFEHVAHEIASDLLQYVPVDASIKVSRLVLTNRSSRPRRLSVTAYVEWVLGPSRSASLAFVSTELDAVTGAIFARNPWNMGFGTRVAFADLRGAQSDWTGDRREFIGRNGALADPAALAGVGALSKKVGAGLDPCAAMRTKIELPPNGSVEIVFLLGEAASADEARSLVARYRAADLDAVEAEIARQWDDILGAIVVKTPVRSMDVMLNGWLLYQTLSCRIWARSGFYQASGAYGFRDQLQDGMALAASQPLLTREHLLRAAARQFVEGDVQHWWLPHSGQGVRTRISDDRPWLAFAVAHYVDATADIGVLDEKVPFLEGQALAPGEHDSFFAPVVSDRTATLYEHCALALDASLALGGHGLPLMGTGDWNDGMNRVGERGAGESVWLGWFLHAALTAFIPLARARRERKRAAKWAAHAAGLQASLEREAWDGDWYRRAYFDDGEPLGTATSEECRIDSIAQSWAVLSGAAAPERAMRAMGAVERELIRRDDGLALLFAPPFDKTARDPGYIKGYPPGVRENGGQYTHAALWSAMAFAALGDGDKAVGLFSLLNPINHARTRADVFRYKVEPYVVAADVYARPPHAGRGGWTWYTGSAGWMQRAGVESILGLRLRGAFLHLDPCIPKAWATFAMSVRRQSARYEIIVDNPAGVSRGVLFAEIDGVEIAERPLRLRMVDDGAVHRVRVTLG